MNLAKPLLGPLWELYVGALGDSGAWVLGHLTIIGILATIGWVIYNHNQIISGLDLRPRTIGGAVVTLAFSIALYFYFLDSLGFPFLGALITALCSVGFILWCYNMLEGAKA